MRLKMRFVGRREDLPPTELGVQTERIPRWKSAWSLLPLMRRSGAASSPWCVRADSPRSSVGRRVGTGSEDTRSAPGAGGPWEGRVQNLLDNLGKHFAEVDWKEHRLRPEKLPPPSPKPQRLFKGGPWRGEALSALGKLLFRAGTQRPRGQSGPVRRPTQDPLSGHCRCAAPHALATEPAHPGDPVQPDTAGLPLLWVPHPHAPMVSSRSPGFPNKGHLSHPFHTRLAHNRYSARPGNLKGPKRGESGQISWVDPLVQGRKRPARGGAETSRGYSAVGGQTL